MSLNRAAGNMYNWVTHTHSHLYGRCSHRCSYCYAMKMRARDPRLQTENQNKTYLAESELRVNYNGLSKEPRTIFIEHMNDLFAPGVRPEWIHAILVHARRYPIHSYVFQTKNPARAVKYLSHFPPFSTIGTTIETNRDMREISHTPSAQERFEAMKAIRDNPDYVFQIFVTIEPILDFDFLAFAAMLVDLRPNFVAIGADSKKCDLPEPNAEKVQMLIRVLEAKKIEVRRKANLARIMVPRT